VLQAQAKLSEHDGEILILYADTPLLRAESLECMRELKRASGAGLVMLTADVPLPGRVVRDANGQVLRVVETVDATPNELATLREGNTGVYLVDAPLLWEALDEAQPDNQQGEIYLTAVVPHSVQRGRGVEALRLEDAAESLGVNTRGELAEAAAVMRARIAQRWMAAGVTLIDPANTYIDVDVEIGSDTLIEPGCVIQGASRIGASVHLKSGCVIEASIVEDGVEMGPFAHLRPGCRIGPDSRIGNFVEVKNSVLGAGVKADHLAYIGDADVGARSSFGCGAIVVNYDWQTKSRTSVGEGVRIGCNANLIAPVRIESHSAIAAGSTITENVPSGALAVARARQENVEGWMERRAKGASKPARSRALKARKPKASARKPSKPARAKTSAKRRATTSRKPRPKR
jgi:bifunctional UDP-N-acetylglucosamine pyrophosphorylase/glucosamine-1-phosphate N-acetyltransferase